MGQLNYSNAKEALECEVKFIEYLYKHKCNKAYFIHYGVGERSFEYPKSIRDRVIYIEQSTPTNNANTGDIEVIFENGTHLRFDVKITKHKFGSITKNPCIKTWEEYFEHKHFDFYVSMIYDSKAPEDCQLKNITYFKLDTVKDYICSLPYYSSEFRTGNNGKYFIFKDELRYKRL